MMNAIDSDKIESHLQRICDSKAIGRAQHYKDLLRYLVARSIKGEPPKEAEIAADIFARDVSSDDGSVRVYVHNLRKKLDTYYQNEGKGDTLRIEIPSGSYSVVLAPLAKGDADDMSESLHRKLAPWMYVLILALTLSVLLNAHLMYLHDSTSAIVGKNKAASSLALASHPIWQGFLQSEQAVLFVLGDFFVFAEVDDELNRRRTIRDSTINTENDFKDFLLDHPQLRGQVRESEIPYLTKGSAFALQHLLPVFVRQPTEFKLSSQLTSEDLRTRNIVYLGPVNTN